MVITPPPSYTQTFPSGKYNASPPVHSICIRPCTYTHTRVAVLHAAFGAVYVCGLRLFDAWKTITSVETSRFEQLLLDRRRPEHVLNSLNFLSVRDPQSRTINYAGVLAKCLNLISFLFKFICLMSCDNVCFVFAPTVFRRVFLAAARERLCCLRDRNNAHKIGRNSFIAFARCKNCIPRITRERNNKNNDGTA